MNTSILAGILLATAVSLVVWKPDESPEEELVQSGISLSKRERRKSFEGRESARAYLERLSNRDSLGRSDYDRMKSAMRMFDEDELLEMASADDDRTDQVSVWRRAAMWERLGELKGEAALEMLLGRRKGWHFISPKNLKSSDQAVHAFVGGWASSLGSLEEIQEELFPHLKSLKEAGFARHERALGREMARFDAMAAWNLLSPHPDGDSPFTGNDEVLIGLVRGLAGDPGLMQLMPFIHTRLRLAESPVVVTSGSRILPSNSGTVQWVLGEQTLIAPQPGESTTIDLLENGITNSEWISSLVVLRSDTPHLLSEAVGALMVSNPDAARVYLEHQVDQPIEVETARPDQVWETLAGIDPGVSMKLLDDPEFADFVPGIATGLVENAPERVKDLLGRFDDGDFQQTLLAEAVNALNHGGENVFLPGDSFHGSLKDPKDRRVIVEEAIASSNLSDEAKGNLHGALQAAVWIEEN